LIRLLGIDYRCICNDASFLTLLKPFSRNLAVAGAVFVKGTAMTVEYVDGIKIMHLHDCNGAGGGFDDTMAMLRIWQLVTGGHSMRDQSVFNRRL
jgi:hypothetical protein